MNTSFFNRNKVLLIGLMSAVLLSLNELFKTGETSMKALAFAAFLAGLSFLANNLRGQWATIAGILGTAVTTYLTMETEGKISWPQIILQAIAAFLATVSPPAKSRGYEHTATIEGAKLSGERMTPTPMK